LARQVVDYARPTNTSIVRRSGATRGANARVTAGARSGAALPTIATTPP